MDNSIYIAFYLGRTKDNPKSSFLDNAVCFFTKSRYSHCELVLGIDEENRGNCWSASPREGCVRNKTIKFDKHWEVYKIDTVLEQHQFETFFKKEEEKKYDYFGALGVKFPFFKHSKNRWFCSEITMASWGYATPHRYSPQNVYDVFVKELYEQQVF